MQVKTMLGAGWGQRQILSRSLYPLSRFFDWPLRSGVRTTNPAFLYSPALSSEALALIQFAQTRAVIAHSSGLMIDFFFPFSIPIPHSRAV